MSSNRSIITVDHHTRSLLAAVGGQGRREEVSQHRARDSTLFCEGLVISLLGFVGTPPGATSFCSSNPSLALFPGGTVRKSSISGPAPMALPACGAARGPRDRAAQRRPEAEGPRVKDCTPSRMLAAPCRQKRQTPQRTLYVTFVGSQGPQRETEKSTHPSSLRNSWLPGTA